jgi:cytidylate kinase
MAGLPAETVAEREERVAGLVERMARSLAIAAPEVFIATGETPVTGPNPEDEIVHQTEAVINEAVREGNVVLVGRGAQAYLGAREGTLHVYVAAPFDLRATRAMERLSLSRRDAERKVSEIDDGRRQYVKTYYRRVWDDPGNYHVTVNTGTFSYEESAGLIVQAAEVRGIR